MFILEVVRSVHLCPPKEHMDALYHSNLRVETICSWWKVDACEIPTFFLVLFVSLQ